MLAAAPDPDQLAALFKAASEPIRLRILALLAHGELCVCHLHALLDAPQPTVSRHLAILRHAGLVSARRDGSWVHYSLTAAVERWLAAPLAGWRADEETRRSCASIGGCS
jgi:ArsR family transcriptional regulator